MRGAMDGKTCLVTGATAGVGQEIALGLARQGGTVVIVGRSADKCAATARDLRSRSGNASIELLVADLSSQASIRELARLYGETYGRLDVLVNNAGGLYLKRETTVDGLEMTFALDHLAYFLLTNLLLPLLKASAPARVVSTASNAHSRGKIDFDDLQGEKRYGAWRAYAQAKLANVLFTTELARRLEGTPVTANCFHPGFVASNFAQNNSGLFPRLFRMGRPFALSPQQGAETGIYLASSPEVEGVTGKYFVKKKPARTNKLAYDMAIAARLWEVSAQMTGLAV